jgi:hypothetical protein
MKKPEIFRINFEPPHHGWLPIDLSINDKKINFFASDVPNNPIQKLVNALHLANKNIPAEVWWHLEPDSYYFKFEHEGDLLRFKITFKPNANKQELEIVSIKVTKAEILMPIWRMLRKFQSGQFAKPHWPPVDYGNMESIKADLAAS